VKGMIQEIFSDCEISITIYTLWLWQQHVTSYVISIIIILLQMYIYIHARHYNCSNWPITNCSIINHAFDLVCNLILCILTYYKTSLYVYLMCLRHVLTHT
jgi:hypothetical protein